MTEHIIPYGKQFITQDDIDAVVETLSADYLTQGPKILEFETAFSEYIGCKFSVAVANGTAALHLCAIALSINEGDKVITSPITFAATANCVRYCGGTVIFADIDPQTYLLDINKVKSLLENSPKGSYKGIIPVDFGGKAVDLEAFRNLADEHGLWIIEDACHAPGGYFKNSQNNLQNCGNGNFADLAIFSFHPVKHIATGEGGMITTNSRELYDKLLKLRTHGITRSEDEFQNSRDFANGQSNSVHYPGWYMEMQELGYNYRLTDIQAALGLSQLKRAEEGLNRRTLIARKYDEEFRKMPEIIAQFNELNLVPSGHAYHLYLIQTEKRLQLYNYLKERKIFAQVHYIPTHLMPYYKELGWREGDFPCAENYYKRCLSLPMYPSLSDEEQNYVIQSIRDFFREVKLNTNMLLKDK
ncbi:UDP-4-amino-4,6-dideoxy-N-acetyl-beta-L-altrosamine transaminase [Daejeonella sp.]|uniref:UDP-4-amino-4, 6-dideoxy-N-acetyl-beta-L-altrosamine transaminase n=1 Tax=Daejeonella sp. TaxID=2805397 RepID=UPI0030C63A98